MGTPIAPEAAYRALVNLDEEGKLPLRVSMTYYVNTASLAETAVEKLDEFARKYRSDNAWINTLKITLDSVLENQKAAMLEPYPTTGNPGALYFDHEQMKSMVLGAAAKGYHVTVHCIGDLAVRATLDAAEEVRGAGHREIRFSTTHTQMVNPADRGRLKQLDVTVQTTGNWAMQQPALIEHLGQERYDRDQFPFRAWADDSVNIAMGADWPATPGGFEHGVNPFNNIYTAMHRRPPAVLVSEMASTGDPLPPVDQVLTLEEAIRSYTLGGARMLGIDDQVGSIVVGKKADLILLSQNLFEIPPDELPNTRVLATMMGGRWFTTSPTDLVTLSWWTWRLSRRGWARSTIDLPTDQEVRGRLPCRSRRP
jgi:predicted amidohydrolase YtcJ